MSIKEVIKILKQNRHLLSNQQFRTLKGQAIAGEGAAAVKGLQKILNRKQQRNNSEKR